MKFLVSLIFLYLIFLIPVRVIAQDQHVEEEIKIAYIYQFSNNIQWEGEEEIESFTIGYLGHNPKVIKYLNDLSRLKRWNNKPIEIKHFRQVQNFSGIQLLYVDREYSEAIRAVYRKIEGKPTLMVSDQSTLQEFVMINFVVSKGNTLKFEVNRPNIFIQGLNIKPELLLLGGTEIDVITIYRQARLELEETRNKLQNEKEKAAKSSLEIKQLNKELKGYERDVKIQKEEIAVQAKAITSQRKKIKSQEDNLKSIEASILEMQNTLERKSERVNKYGRALDLKERQLEERKKEMSGFDAKIDAQLRQIAEQEERIKNQDSELNEQGLTIEKQQTILFISLAVIVLISFLVFLIMKGYSQKRKSNLKLTKQNTKIERQKEVLTVQAQKLHDQKEIVQSTLNELQQAQSKLVQSEKMASLGVLTAGIAHEINNPINFVLAGSQSLQENYKDLALIIDKYEELEGKPESKDIHLKLEEVKENLDFEFLKTSIIELIEDIHLGAVRTTEIVRGLRNFSRLDDEKMQPSDIHEGIDAALTLLKNKLKNRIDVIKHYDESIGQILCFPGQLSQVFMNMVSNAADAISEEGNIEITTKKVKNDVIITFKDDGFGIKNEDAKKIFDPFFTTKAVGSGVGLGLSMSFGIVEKHEGKIEVSSEEGKGTKFNITLPIK